MSITCYRKLSFYPNVSVGNSEQLQGLDNENIEKQSDRSIFKNDSRISLEIKLIALGEVRIKDRNNVCALFME